MSREPGRWLLVAALALTALLFTSGIAEAGWSARASGPARDQAISMPLVPAPVVVHNILIVALSNVGTVQLPVLSGSTRVSGCIVHRYIAAVESPPPVALACSGTGTTRTFTDLFPVYVYTYRVAATYQNWVGLVGPVSN